ncbi:MAG TPA: LanC-like protein [Bdellovibrionota bacterium]|jgi:hypothetical protein|nr:LanC-like protein [Bdellovibrionota bacterium]
MLYIPERHLPFATHPWDEGRVRETISDILLRTRNGLAPTERLWPLHPKDVYEACPPFSTNFYFGAAGVLWAVRELAPFAQIESELPSIDDILAEHLKTEDTTPDSAFCGELGIRFVKQILSPCSENSKILKFLIQRASKNPCREILYGGPGALAMAHSLWRRGDDSYRELCTEVAQRLLEQRETDELSGARIWTQHLGTPRNFVGAAHGSAGNFGVLIRVLRDLGETNTVRELIHDAETFLRAYSRVQGEFANWPRGTDESEYSTLLVVHWCHGATGMVTDVSGSITAEESPSLDELFLKAANLVWRAGPLEKGPSLCHGTAGSGLACLKMFERTRAELWLERARGLAMFAIKQYRSELALFGQARFSLWTGDLGLAIFLRDVLNKEGTLPGLE